MADRRIWISALFVVVTATAYPQIDTAAAGCAVLNAALAAEAGTEAEEGVVAISLEVWSEAVMPWTYEVETSSGAIFVVSSDATVVERVRGARNRSRKQLERSATARAILSGKIPTLCDLLGEHYRSAPGSVLLEAELEYERGSFEATLEYLNAVDSRATREREWEWDR